MRLLDIDLGDARIMLHHIERAMAKQRLQREDIAARTQIRNRKGVSETMGVTFLDAGFFAQMTNQQAQGVLIHRTIIFHQEQWRFRIFTIFSFRQIPPHGATGCFAQEYGATFATFRAAHQAMPDLNSTSFQISIANS
jgi:hypothetical protein